jgi:hypothetical protein
MYPVLYVSVFFGLALGDFHILGSFLPSNGVMLWNYVPSSTFIDSCIGNKELMRLRDPQIGGLPTGNLLGDGVHSSLNNVQDLTILDQFGGEGSQGTCGARGGLMTFVRLSPSEYSTWIEKPTRLL